MSTWVRCNQEDQNLLFQGRYQWHTSKWRLRNNWFKVSLVCHWTHFMYLCVKLGYNITLVSSLLQQIYILMQGFFPFKINQETGNLCVFRFVAAGNVIIQYITLWDIVCKKVISRINHLYYLKLDQQAGLRRIFYILVNSLIFL